MRLPCGNNGLNAGLELNDTNLGLLIQESRLDLEQIGPSSQAICLVCIVECVKYLHCEPLIANVSLSLGQLQLV